MWATTTINISFEDAVDLVGMREAARVARDVVACESTAEVPRWLPSAGIIIADTKFELGFIDGELALCDEVLTPDSSRFWPADAWKPGTAPPSFDKQPLARLARGEGLGQDAAAAAAARRGGRRDPRALRRRLRADHRAVASPTGTGRERR